ncbi:Bax inhibitor-1/YccA family protein [Carnobacterium gallinarum]|uniref:Bax inhibitor-1/YccA family protein n=1 Tax=Carnobacterium gallinarum TaxID=2749 RepID=UPI00054E51C9|nr:Bax inhibitor-1/YccA family protein [Carnobacterium gallinarum]
MQTQRKEVATEGLSRFFATVYGYMTLALALSGITAFYAAQSPLIRGLVLGNPIGFIALFLVEIFLVMKLASNGNKLRSTGSSVVGFIAFSIVNGILLSSIFLLYSLGNIASAFMITAGTFAAMSIYGFVTKRDMTSLGGHLRSALIGLIIATLVNAFFLKSGIGSLVLSYITVLIFVGLTAYDTQKLKEIYFHYADSQSLGAIAISGALSLYLDFVNIFLAVLRIFGGGGRN